MQAYSKVGKWRALMQAHNNDGEWWACCRHIAKWGSGGALVIPAH